MYSKEDFMFNATSPVETYLLYHTLVSCAYHAPCELCVSCSVWNVQYERSTLLDFFIFITKLCCMFVACALCNSTIVKLFVFACFSCLSGLVFYKLVIVAWVVCCSPQIYRVFVKVCKVLACFGFITHQKFGWRSIAQLLSLVC